MNKQWVDAPHVSIPDDLRVLVGGHELVAQTLVRRGLSDVERTRRFLDPNAYITASSYDLPDMKKAVTRLKKAIKDGERILVWGDFDVDGQTSTALLVQGLRELGADGVKYYIPQRKGEGHGIHVERLKNLLEGISVLVTCDTGISAHDAIDYAQDRGVDVIVTDHHALPDDLPKAHAIINPMRLVEGHPLRELPGVGTAYKLIEALFGAECEHLLDLVALGIVADVMVLVDDTRYLLQRGLNILSENERPALKALMTLANITSEYVTEADIGFSIAPRMNALGRLEDANPIVEFLTTSNHAFIQEWAGHLERLNQERRGYTQQIYKAAVALIEGDASLLKYAALIVVGRGWETGIVGIVASKLVERYGLPTFVLSQDGDMIHGSARSVVGVDIIKAIKTQAHLLDGYGGHTMAAGVNLSAKNLVAFRRGISQAVRVMRQDVTGMPPLVIDGIVGFGDVTLDFVEDIKRLAPFGNGNPSLVLVTQGVRLKSVKKLTRDGEHIAVTLVDSAGDSLRVMWWGGNAESIPTGIFDVAYEVRISSFKGNLDVIAEWVDFKVDETVLKIDNVPIHEMIDARTSSDAQLSLAKYQANYPAHLVYSEGVDSKNGVTRYGITPTETLIAWSIPPSVRVWEQVLKASQAKRVILVGALRPITDEQMLIKILIGLCKYAIQAYGGIIGRDVLCSKTGQSEAVIEICLDWLSARGLMSFDSIGTEKYQVSEGSQMDEVRLAILSDKLNKLLGEVRAYIDYWTTMRIQD